MYCRVPWQTEDGALLQHFSQFGAVEEAQIMRERYTGKSRGFGFVTYATAADAQRAVAADHVVDGRRCEAKFALPEGKVGSARTTRIFVARIPSSVSDAEFRGYFEQFGAVQDAYMPKDPSKQGHRGIGFVTYASAEAVERVMANSHVLNGNEVAIDRATPKDRAALLPGRLSMSQPNLHFMRGGAGQIVSPGGSAHGGNAFNLMRGGGSVASSPGARFDGSGGAYGGMSRRLSHPVLSGGPGAHFGSPNRSAGALSAALHATGGPGGGMPHPGSFHGSSSHLLAHAQAQAAALQHHFNGGSSSHNSLDSPAGPHAQRQQQQQQQQLVELINANVAAAAAAGGGPPPHPGGPGYHQMGHHPQAVPMPVPQPPPAHAQVAGSMGHSSSLGGGGSGNFPSSGPPSSNNIAALMPQPSPQDHQAQLAAAGWLGPGSGMPPPPQQRMPPPGVMGPPSARAGPRIFVGKLNRDTTEQDVKDYFSSFGFVLDVYLPRDKANKREHRGFGFVTFETEASIARVLAHGPHQIRGAVVAIDAAVPRQEEMILTIDPAGGAGSLPLPLQPPPQMVAGGGRAAASPADHAEVLHGSFEALTLSSGAEA